MRLLGDYEIYGTGDDCGGEQWVCFANECSGAKVALSGGFDYGSWIEFAANVDEEDYKKIQAWETYDVWQKYKLINDLKEKYSEST